MKNNTAHALRVLHVIHGFGAGGAETWLLKAVAFIKSNNIKVQFDFLCTGGERNLFDSEIEALGSKIYYEKFTLKGVFKFRKSFIDILKSNHYDAIHHHQDFVSGWHFLLAMGSLPKIKVSHLHNPYNFVRNYITNPSRHLSYHIGKLITFLLTTKITGTSESVMDEYGYNKWPYSLKRSSAIYCGFDVDQFVYNNSSKSIICQEMDWLNMPNLRIAIFIGRMSLQPGDSAKNQKNPEFAFEIAKKLVLNSSWKFIFVGHKGDVGKRMEEEVFSLGLDHKIKFLDIRKDIPNLLSAADIFVFPSYWEGLGMVAVEAQASGT